MDFREGCFGRQTDEARLDPCMRVEVMIESSLHVAACWRDRP